MREPLDREALHEALVTPGQPWTGVDVHPALGSTNLEAARLAERGIRSLLLEGGPHLNASFLAAGLIDEVYWTIGAHLLGTDALSMIAPVPGGSPYAHEPRPAQLISVLHHEGELFLRYRCAAAG